MYIAIQTTNSEDGNVNSLDVFIPQGQELVRMIKKAKGMMKDFAKDNSRSVDNTQSFSMIIPLKGVFAYYEYDLSEAYSEILSKGPVTVVGLPKAEAKIGIQVFLRVWSGDYEPVEVLAIEVDNEMCEYTGEMLSVDLKNYEPIDIEKEFAD